MKNYLLTIALLILCLTGINVLYCLGQNHNQELAELYRNDQSDRQQIAMINMDFEYFKQLKYRDSTRLARVYQLLDSNRLSTGQDYYNAAMIFQHGGEIRHSEAAVALMRKAVGLDSTVNKWLLAAAIDRNLVKQGRPQIYGTQFVKDDNGIWFRCSMDTTAISDEERKEFNVETLAEQREKLKSFNKISLFQLFNEVKDVKKLSSFCRNEWLNKGKSAYNLSETEFNDLGYYLMQQKRYSEAYVIFLLNTEFYPNAFNTYDSLGECLLKSGRVEEGLAAYRKSLELNPHNQNAKTVLNARIN